MKKNNLRIWLSLAICCWLMTKVILAAEESSTPQENIAKIELHRKKAEESLLQTLKGLKVTNLEGNKALVEILKDQEQALRQEEQLKRAAKPKRGKKSSQNHKKHIENVNNLTHDIRLLKEAINLESLRNAFEEKLKAEKLKLESFQKKISRRNKF